MDAQKSDVMTGPLVGTKLVLPPARPQLVTRPRLSDRLDRPGGRLVVVSAPAGFGKTTLLRSWLTDPAAGSAAIAWVSLDEGDHVASTFWAYVFASMDRAVPGTGASALAALEAGHQPDDGLLAGLLN